MILVFGSVNLDLVFPVRHLPKGGETVLGEAFHMLPGGKGANQALAAALDGADVRLAGAVGKDAFAAQALERVRQQGIDLTYMAGTEAATGCAAIIVAENGENQIAVASGANALASETAIPDALLGPGSTILLQCEVPPEANQAIARRTRAAGGRVILNLAPVPGDPAAMLDHIDVLIANEGEAASLGDPAELAQRIGGIVVVTLGAKGAVAYRPDGEAIAQAAIPVVPVDTTGAGDCFSGVFAAALDRGLTLDKALARAVAASGLACLARGAQPSFPNWIAIDEAMTRHRTIG